MFFFYVLELRYGIKKKFDDLRLFLSGRRVFKGRLYNMYPNTQEKEVFNRIIMFTEGDMYSKCTVYNSI